MSVLAVVVGAGSRCAQQGHGGHGSKQQAPRVRILLGDLLADIQDCESEMGTYAPLDA